jgi:hypothetical protein
MKRLAIAFGLLAALVVYSWGGPDSGTAAGKTGKKQTAAKIVIDVLQREARESISDRAELLKPALEQVSKYEPAMWQSGFVFDTRQKEWLRYDEVPAEVKGDKNLSNYLSSRSKYPDTVEGQIELARWCLKRNLTDQARAHLTRVLEVNQDNPEARRLLGQRQVAGNWLGEKEIAQAEEQVQKQLAAIRKWKPKLEKISKNLDSGKRQSDAARAELMSIRDPEAAVAIEVILCAEGGDKALLGVEALKNLPGRESAASLSRLAVFGGWEQIGRAAARALGSQNMHDYVPQLLSLMQSPVQSRMEIYGSFANGTMLSRHAFYREGQDQKELAVLDTPYQHVFAEPSGSVRQNTQNPRLNGKNTMEEQVGDMIKRKAAMERFQTDAMQRAAQIEAGVSKYNTTAEAMNSRICNILSEATTESTPKSNSTDTGDKTAQNAYGPKTPSEWSQWWNDYNETYSPESPMRRAYVSNPTKVILSEPTKTYNAPQSTYNSNSSTSSSITGAGPAYRTSTPTTSGLHTGYDCLSGDTSAWTEKGPVAIKDVAVGDRVLACDVETGCLALKPVLRKTIRPKEHTGELVTIGIDGKTILTSGGHVFWVAGEGWLKARDLKAGMRLHTLKGTANINTVGTSEALETYNLIIADFHTYFAGDQMSLTHDNTIRQPTNMVVPGLSKQAAELSQAE